MCILLACMPVGLHITCMPGSHRDQKKTLSALELELQMVMRHHVYTRS